MHSPNPTINQSPPSHCRNWPGEDVEKSSGPLSYSSQLLYDQVKHERSSKCHTNMVTHGILLAVSTHFIQSTVIS